MTKSIKHGNHEHILRLVNENVLGLLIDDRGTNAISQAFAWDEKKSIEMVRKLQAFEDFQHAAERLNEGLPESTRVSMFVDFLKSNTFKQLGIPIKTPNDYFMLGFVLAAVIGIDKIKDNMAGQAGMPDVGNLKELLGELKKVKRMMEEEE